MLLTVCMQCLITLNYSLNRRIEYIRQINEKSTVQLTGLGLTRVVPIIIIIMQ